MGFKLESLREGDANRRAESKPRVVTALPKGGHASRSIYTALGSMEGSGVHLKCSYTNTHNMTNKWGELDVLVSSQSYDANGINETWCNESHECWDERLQAVQEGQAEQARWRSCTVCKERFG